LLVVLHRLNPLERAVMVLRELGYACSEIAQAIGKSEVHCRKLYSLARGKVRQAPGVDVAQDTLVDEYLNPLLRGIRTSDFDPFVAKLNEDARLFMDGGGRGTTAIRPIHGKERIARLLKGLCRRNAFPDQVSPVSVNGQRGALLHREGRVSDVVALAFDTSGIREMFWSMNPEKWVRCGVHGAGSSATTAHHPI
jgi:RNA polymerase sigma-70 factor (ECF subfamily)